MLRFDSVALRRGSKLLFADASVQLHAGWRVGVTGRNGAGKSSLFALVAGELQPDAGNFTLPRDWVLAHVRQETPALAQCALDYILDGDHEYREIERALAAAESSQDALTQAQLHERLHAIGGYAARSRAIGFGGAQERAAA